MNGCRLPQNDWKADTPRWSPDDCIIYFTAERDGYRCIYGQPVNRQTKAPEGEPFPVYHAHSARQSLLNALASFEEISIGHEGIAFVMGEVTGTSGWLPYRKSDRNAALPISKTTFSRQLRDNGLPDLARTPGTMNRWNDSLAAKFLSCFPPPRA